MGLSRVGCVGLGGLVVSSLREAIKREITVGRGAERTADAVLGVVEAWLRERDAAARQRIEALWDRQAITGFPEEFYNRALGDVLEALGGGASRSIRGAGRQR